MMTISKNSWAMIEFVHLKREENNKLNEFKYVANFIQKSLIFCKNIGKCLIF